MNQIDLAPIVPGYGMIWQGSEIDAWFDRIPSPKAVVSMIGDIGLGPCVSCAMGDNDIDILPDVMLLAMCDAAIGFLGNGFNLLVHCFEGKYRSTYMDVAIHMRLGMAFDDAFALVRRRHTLADLRPGTKNQLMRMEGKLHV